MADLEFNEPQYARPTGYGPGGSWLTALVIKIGLAKDAAGAQKALIIILIVAVLATILVLLFTHGSSGSLVPLPPPAP